MEISRVSAIVLAVLAAVLVIVAGKSCAEDINETNKKNASKHPKATTFYNDSTNSYQYDTSYYYYETEAETEDTTEINYEEVTNMLGSVVATIPITTEEEVTEAVTTKELSILEAYEERHTTAAAEQPDSNGYTTIDIDSIEIPTKIIIEMY